WEASIGPGVEVAASVHLAARPLLPPNRPVLFESLRSIDAGGGVSGRPAEVVDAVVAVNLAKGLGAGRGVIGSEVLDDVVLNEGVAHPAVDAEIAVSVGLVGAGVFDAPVIFVSGAYVHRRLCLARKGCSPLSQTGVPSLATNKVAAGLPLNTVAA